MHKCNHDMSVYFYYLSVILICHGKFGLSRWPMAADLVTGNEIDVEETGRHTHVMDLRHILVRRLDV